MFQIAAETVDFYNARNAGQLALYHPVLNGAELHCVILLFVTGSYLQYILVNLSQSGGDGHHFRCSQFGRDFSGYGLYLFVDELPGIERRNTLFENNRYYG